MRKWFYNYLTTYESCSALDASAYATSVAARIVEEIDRNAPMTDIVDGIYDIIREECGVLEPGYAMEAAEMMAGRFA